MCDVKQAKETFQSRSLQQRMSIAKISLHCILDVDSLKENHKDFIKNNKIILKFQ